jgi:nitroreductase
VTPTLSIDALGELAMSRRSVRAFLPREVPREVIDKVLEVTLATPSNCNIQPWFIEIVSGDTLRRWSEALLHAAEGGTAPDHDIAEAGPYAGVFRERQIDAARRLFAAQGIERGDTAGRIRSLLRNYRFFDAPHVALFCVPDWAGPRELADCGQAMQSFLLAATAAGLGTCPQGSLGGYSALTRSLLQIPEDRRILGGISFGFPDAADVTAKVRTPRCHVTEVVRFHD